MERSGNKQKDSAPLYMLYGNHDMVKKNQRYIGKNCSAYPCCYVNPRLDNQPLLPNIQFYEGIILQNTAVSGSMDVYLTHVNPIL